jgi:zinc protease
MTSCTSDTLTRDSIAKMEKVPMPAFDPTKATTTNLRNGATLFLLEDRELPIVNIYVLMRAGSIYEPADKTGLASLTGMLLENGGTKSKVPQEVDRIIDDNALGISISATRESMSASLKALSSKLPVALPLLFELLTQPRLDDERLNIDRLKFIEQLKRDKDDPFTVAARAYRKLVYGKDNPWARVPEEADVKKLSRDDIVKFVNHYVRPSNMLIAVSGDFNSQEMKSQIENALSGAQEGRVEFPEVAQVVKEFKPDLEFIDRDVKQANIFMGHLGIKRHNPDKFAIIVMNMILGGDTFLSRLGRDIRMQRGLAYSVRSSFGWDTDYGLSVVYAGTKAVSENEVTRLIQEAIQNLWAGDQISDDEFNRAKQTILNQLIFDYDSAAKLAQSQATFAFNGYPPDYLEVFRKGIQAVTKEDVKRVAHKYLHPDGLKTLILSSISPENEK